MTDIRREELSDTTPPRLAETTPPSYYTNDHSFTLQAIMEMQKTLGGLTQAVNTLTEESKKSRDKLDEISHNVFAAKKVMWVVGTILSFLAGSAIFILNKIWDTILPLLQTNLHLK